MMPKPIEYVVMAQKAIIVVCSVVVAGTFGVVVVLRYGFSMDLFAYEEWLLTAAFALYFIGGAQASYENSHIKADLVYQWLRTYRGRRRYRLLIFALEALIGAVLSYWGYQMMAEELARYPNLAATPVYGIPLAVPRGAICLGFVLMTLYSGMHFVRLWSERSDVIPHEAERNA